MTYGIPHTVRGWGDEVVTTVAMPPGPEFDEYTAVVRGTEPGPVILVPTVALAPVDTTPAEPEPGAWDLGGVLCVRDAGSAANRWYWCLLDQGRSAYTTWKGLWAKHGGSGITPRRLVPEPEPVELPWHHEDREGYGAWVNESPRHWAAARVSAPDDNSSADLTPEAAEEMAAALLAAARAAREVKP